MEKIIKKLDKKLKVLNIESHSRMTTRLKEKIVDNSKGMSARTSKALINNGLVNISDDTILRLLKKNDKFNR